VVSPDLGDAAAKLSIVADEAGQLLKDARAGKGSVGKLLTDDSLYTELNGLAKDARVAVGKSTTKRRRWTSSSATAGRRCGA